MTAYQVRKVGNCELVKVGSETTWSVFQHGRCIESGFRSLKAAQGFAIELSRIDA